MLKYQKNLMEKTNKIFAVYGAGGCGRGLISFVKQNFIRTRSTFFVSNESKLHTRRDANHRYNEIYT